MTYGRLFAKLQSELETIHRNAEQHNTKKDQFLYSIDMLKTNLNANERKLNEMHLKLSGSLEKNVELENWES